MATEKRPCPSCNAKVAANADKCPKCSVQLRLLSWELEDSAGAGVVYEGEAAESTLRDELIAGTRRLSDRCRQRVRVLQGVIGDQKEYGAGSETEWKTFRDYASQVFSLQVLYDPVGAYGKFWAKGTWAVVGIIAAVGWNMSLLLARDANPVIAFVLSVILIALTPTVIGIIIGSIVVGAFYNLPATAMGFRSLIAIIIGLAVGAAVGWTLGYAIGAMIGASKPKLVREPA